MNYSKRETPEKKSTPKGVPLDENGFLQFRESLLRQRHSVVLTPLEQDRIDLIRQAIQEDKVVAFRYHFGPGDVSERRIAPIDAYRGFRDRLYVKGYDFLRDEDRNFRLDRMVGLRLE